MHPLLTDGTDKKKVFAQKVKFPPKENVGNVRFNCRNIVEATSSRNAILLINIPDESKGSAPELKALRTYIMRRHLWMALWNV